MKKIIICLVSLLLSINGFIFAESDKYFIENYFTNLAQVTLDSMFGEGNFVARVQVQMTQSQYKVQYTEESNPKVNKSNKSDEQVYILPGVPALKNIAPGSLNQMPFNSVTTLVQSKIKRMSIYILADRNYPKSQSRKAEAVLKEMLNFKEDRNDQYVMNYKPFYSSTLRDTQTVQMIPGPENYFSIQNIVYYVLITLILLAILIYVIYQKKSLAFQKSADSGGANVNVNPNLELPDGIGGGSDGGSISIDQQKIKRYFDFVSNDNIDDFIVLIKKQSLKPEFIALIVSFLSSHLAAKLIKQLDPKIQSKIAMDLIEQRLTNRELLDKLETKLKSDLECFVGGQSKFTKIFENISNHDKKEIIQRVEKENPKNYKKIRPYVLLFDDLVILEEDEIQLILSDVNLDILSKALIGVDEHVKEFILTNLTSSARDIVSQYLELKSDSTTKEETDKAQESVIRLIKKMEEKGSLNIADKISEL